MFGIFSKKGNLPGRTATLAIMLAGGLFSVAAQALQIDPDHPLNFTNSSGPLPIATSPLGPLTKFKLGNLDNCFSFDPLSGKLGARGWYGLGISSPDLGVGNGLEFSAGDFVAWSDGLTPAKNTLVKVQGFVGNTASGKQYFCTATATNVWYQVFYDVTNLAPRPPLDGPRGGIAIGLFGSSELAVAQITEYGPTPSRPSAPCEVEFDRNGFLWIEEIAANKIGRLDPNTGAIKEFPLSTIGATPGGMELGPDGGIWFTQVVGNKIVRLEPSDGSMEEFPIPSLGALGARLPLGPAVSDDISAGADGAMWFTENGTNGIGRIDVNTKEITEYRIPTLLALPLIIQRGPGNTMIFAESGGNKIGQIDVFTRQFKEYRVPTPAAVPQGVTLGPDGAIWFTETAAQKIGRIDPVTGKVTEISILALRSLPVSIGLGNPLPFPGPMRTGSDGKLYFTEGNLAFAGNRIGQYDPVTKKLQEFVTPTPVSAPCDLNNQRADAIWFGEFSGDRVGKLPIGQ